MTSKPSRKLTYAEEDQPESEEEQSEQEVESEEEHSEDHGEEEDESTEEEEIVSGETREVSPIASDAISTTKKRARDDVNGDVPKSGKKSKIGGKKSGNGGGIPRLWNDDDEIALLKGIVDFRKEKGVHPYADMTGFCDFIKQRLRLDYNRGQLGNKINRFKRKFLNAVEKCEDRKEPVYSKPHDVEVYRLSKKIWGRVDGESGKRGKNINGFTVKKNGRKANEISNKQVDFLVKYPLTSAAIDAICPGGVKDFIRSNLHLIGDKKVREFEEEWGRLYLQQNELFCKKIEIQKNYAQAVKEALNS